MRYNRELQNNNAELQAILDTVNGLPSAGGGEAEILITNLTRLDGLFRQANFEKPIDIVLKPKKIYGANINVSNTFLEAKNVRSVTIGYETDLMWILSSAFKLCSELVEVDLGEKILLSSANNEAFSYASNLESIKTELDLTSATNINGMFGRCSALKEVRFTANSIKLSLAFPMSTQLSDTSIQSIIDGLVDLTGATSQTITFATEIKSKLTEEQISQITSKNWTLA